MANPNAYLLMHDGIRLELRRIADFAASLAAGRRVAGPAQLTALRVHVSEALDALHHHHVAEDDHLWPLLRQRGLGSGDLDTLDALSADHDRLDLLIQRLRTTLADLAGPAESSGRARPNRPAGPTGLTGNNRNDGNDGSSVAALAAITASLHSLMAEHLTTEEALVVPAIEDRISDDELTQLEKRMSRGAKMRLSFVLPWLAAANPERAADVAAGLGPVLPLLLAASRSGYQRRLATAYGDLVVDPGPVLLRGSAEIFVPAPADQVYAAVADVVGMAHHSPECYRCVWLDGASGPAVGARFRGWNRSRGMRWSRECEVVTAEPGREFAYRTRRTRSKPDSTLWRFQLRAHDGGTHLTQTFELSPSALVLRFERLSGRDVSTPVAMRQTLERLRDELTRRPADVDAARPLIGV
ncbi:cyclase [Frankia sp. CcI49]|uniref:hemerythrin domain-containing protein n=1 Tax=Frankia sp. CcI49 TaxID=1745382 RepID=UPI000976DB4D|nr:hemerythrin domain-containing protein [Frankia sp. CcI49]ONH54116.1 cyclase [Frankia sp. CcI49]